MLNHVLPAQLSFLDQPLHVGQDAVGQVKILLQVQPRSFWTFLEFRFRPEGQEVMVRLKTQYAHLVWPGFGEPRLLPGAPEYLRS